MYLACMFKDPLLKVLYELCLRIFGCPDVVTNIITMAPKRSITTFLSHDYRVKLLHYPLLDRAPTDICLNLYVSCNFEWTVQTIVCIFGCPQIDHVSTSVIQKVQKGTAWICSDVFQVKSPADAGKGTDWHLFKDLCTLSIPQPMAIPSVWLMMNHG